MVLSEATEERMPEGESGWEGCDCEAGMVGDLDGKDF